MPSVPPARHFAAREGSRRCPVLRTGGRRGLGPGRRPVPGTLQPRVPACVRRVAARVPADPADGAGGRAAAHRQLGRRYLRQCRPTEHRILHVQFRAYLRWVHDQQEALDFYTRKVGMEFRADVTADDVRNLMAKGFAGTIFLVTEDCRASYEELTGRGVDFVEKPEERPYGIDAAFRDPSRPHSSDLAARAELIQLRDLS